VVAGAELADTLRWGDGAVPPQTWTTVNGRKGMRWGAFTCHPEVRLAFAKAPGVPTPTPNVLFVVGCGTLRWDWT
jgi:hypothetical protein